MKKPLKVFRDAYLETLLAFLWREWTALGIAGHQGASPQHVIDPEALLLFTATMGRYDQRLFDEVIAWLCENGRFINIQRMRNMLGKEPFEGGRVVGAIANYLCSSDTSLKWQKLAASESCNKEKESLFFLPDGRPLPTTGKEDVHFLSNGFSRNVVQLRDYVTPFSTASVPCRVMQLRALFDVNARCDVIAYLAMKRSGYPRELARELYYSQKSIHDVMAELECSGMLHSVKQGRERIYRLADRWLEFLADGTPFPQWKNWPVLLSIAETLWHKLEAVHNANLASLVESSEIILTMKSLQDRLTPECWSPESGAFERRDSTMLLEHFKTRFERAVV